MTIRDFLINLFNMILILLIVFLALRSTGYLIFSRENFDNSNGSTGTSGTSGTSVTTALQDPSIGNASLATRAAKGSDDADTELLNMQLRNSKDKNSTKTIINNYNEIEIDDENLNDKVIKPRKRRLRKKKHHVKKKKIIDDDDEDDDDDYIENFENTDSMNPRDKKLYDAIKKGKLSDEEIQNLIDSDVITENLIEKFLHNVEREGFANPIPFQSTRFGASVQLSNGPVIAPYSGGSYAPL